jgi:hypothetical protein
MRLAVIDSTGTVVNIIEAIDTSFTLPEMTIVEAVEPCFIGGTYTNGVFSSPPVVINPPVTTIPKSVVMARIIAANMMVQAYQGLTSQPILFARWFAPDKPDVECDDPDAVAFVKALNLDPTVILAPL